MDASDQRHGVRCDKLKGREAEAKPNARQIVIDFTGHLPPLVLIRIMSWNRTEIIKARQAILEAARKNRVLKSPFGLRATFANGLRHSRCTEIADDLLDRQLSAALGHIQKFQRGNVRIHDPF